MAPESPDQLPLFEVSIQTPDLAVDGDPMGGITPNESALVDTEIDESPSEAINTGPTGQRKPKPGEPGYTPDYVCREHEQCEEHTYYGQNRCPKWSRAEQRRCRQPIAYPGAPTCKYHGAGNHRATIAKAKLRMIAAADKAVARLVAEMDGAEKAADRIRAADSLLDRTGFRRGVDVVGTDLREVLIERLVEVRERRQLAAAEGGPDDPQLVDGPVDEDTEIYEAEVLEDGD